MRLRTNKVIRFTITTSLPTGHNSHWQKSFTFFAENTFPRVVMQKWILWEKVVRGRRWNAKRGSATLMVCHSASGICRDGDGDDSDGGNDGIDHWLSWSGFFYLGKCFSLKMMSRMIMLRGDLGECVFGIPKYQGICFAQPLSPF